MARRFATGMMHGAIVSVLMLGMLSVLTPLPGRGPKTGTPDEAASPQAALIEAPAGSEFTRGRGDQAPSAPEAMTPPNISALGEIAAVPEPEAENRPMSLIEGAEKPAARDGGPSPLRHIETLPEPAVLPEASGMISLGRSHSPRLDVPPDRVVPDNALDWSEPAGIDPVSHPDLEPIPEQEELESVQQDRPNLTTPPDFRSLRLD